MLETLRWLIVKQTHLAESLFCDEVLKCILSQIEHCSEGGRQAGRPVRRKAPHKDYVWVTGLQPSACPALGEDSHLSLGLGRPEFNTGVQCVVRHRFCIIVKSPLSRWETVVVLF